MKEGIWLERGYEADGLMSLELEPDISISENGEEVSVQGVLNLTGEYRVTKEADSNNSRTESEDLNSMPFRSVEEISFSDEGTGHMHHQFPLDITIPKERIKDLSELAVKVDTFDYHIPERGFLEISAELSIEGVRSEEEAPTEEVETEEILDERSFSFEQVDAEPSNDENEHDVNDEDRKVMEEETSDVENERDYSNENDEEEANESPHYTLKAASPKTESNQQKEETIDLEKAEPDSVIRASEEQSSSNSKEAFESDITTSRDDVTENQQGNEILEDQELEKSEVHEKTDVVGRDEVEESEKENALYLTKMLAGDEEAYSKLRMCIVQSGESLETIADRYRIQPSQLIRMNRLKGEDVSEGQILYIPVKQSSSLE
jgi:stage VI sporulation protein D